MALKKVNAGALLPLWIPFRFFAILRTMSAAAVLCWTALLSLLPISELRGGIPFAIANGIPWYWAYPFAAAFNALAAPGCWFFLATLHKCFLRIRWYAAFFERFVERARIKLREKVEKWGWLGVALFVAVPLPVTGAWTGTLGAWVLGLSRRKTMAAVILGVAAAGAMVSAVTVLGIGALRFLIKDL